MGNDNSSHQPEETVVRELDIEKAKEILNFDRGKITLAGVKDASGREMALCRLDGKLYPPFGLDFLRNVRRTKILPHDVMLCGYPNTGMDWLVQIITSILYGHGAYGSWTDQLGFLESVPLAAPELLPSPRVMYTHMPYRHLPTQIKGLRTKLILSRRNPKDTLVSCYDVIKQRQDIYRYNGDFQDFLPLFRQGQVPYGSYFDYYREWERVIQENPAMPILIVDFEKLKEDFSATIRTLANFLEVEITDTQVDHVVYDARVDDDSKDKQVGMWKDYLSVRQNETIDAEIGTLLRGANYSPRYVL